MPNTQFGLLDQLSHFEPTAMPTNRYSDQLLATNCTDNMDLPVIGFKERRDKTYAHADSEKCLGSRRGPELSVRLLFCITSCIHNLTLLNFLVPGLRILDG